MHVGLKTKASLHIYVHYTYKSALHMCVLHVCITYVCEVKELTNRYTQILTTCVSVCGGMCSLKGVLQS